MNVLHGQERVLGLLHGDAEGDSHFVAGVSGATSYVDGVFSGKRIAEDYEAGFSVRRGTAHLLGIFELADGDVTQAKSDLADRFRG